MPGEKQILINMNSLLAALYTVCAYMVIFAPYQSNSPIYNASMGAFFRYFQYLVAALALLHIARCKKVKRLSGSANINLFNSGYYTLFPQLYGIRIVRLFDGSSYHSFYV